MHSKALVATARAIVLRLNQQIAASLRTPDLKSKLTAQGMEVVGNSPEQFAAYIREEIEKWTRVVKRSGVRVA